jgi:hypothetical protein
MDTFAIFSFTSSTCTFEYNHFIEPGVEGQKVASQVYRQLNMFT